jgi:PBP1b-binding outer membrane lipoprotein LpoB
MRQFYIILIALFIFNGCVKVNEDSYKLKYIHSTSVTNFTDVTDELLKPICPTLKKIDKTIYVTDFVNIKELENHSELGFLLSEELKTLVTQKCGNSIHAIEYSKYLKLGANGTKLLSRDLDDIKNTKINQNSYALVGTYAFTQRQLILYLKLMDLKKGTIYKSSTKRTTQTDEIIHLEQKSAAEKKGIPVYQPMTL